MTIRVFQCCAAGIHSDMHGRTVEFSERDLSFMAVAYDAKRRPAPLTLGHPVDDQPNLGTVRGLIAEGPMLFCLADVGHSLMQLVRAHRYKNVSASFFTPGATASPEPSVHYLKHVGFLGAVPPAMKGMQPLAFSLGPTFDTAGTIDFASPGIVEDSRMQLHRVALELHHALPGVSYSAAASRAERALNR